MNTQTFKKINICLTQTLRSLLYVTGMVMLTLVYGLLCPFTVLLPYAPRYKFINTWGTANLWWLRVTCGLRHIIIGKENIPDYPCIIMANHQSTWETIALGTVFPALTWVVKRELLFIPLFGWSLALTHPIALRRGSGSKAIQQLIRQGQARLRRGHWVLIFPEGTRAPPGAKRNFKIGGAMLAVKSGVPVVPIAHNSGNYWARKQLTKKSGTIKMVIGAPIPSQGKTAEAMNQEVFHWINACRERLEAPGRQ